MNNSPTIQDVEAAVRSVVFDRTRSPVPSTGRGDAVFADRLFALRHAESLPAGTRQVRVAPGTVVTPLARDFLKRQAINVQVVSRGEVEAFRQPGEWGLAIETDSGLISAFRRALLDEARPWYDLGGSAVAARRWVAVAPERGALVVTDEASLAVWRACQVPGVRAASAVEIDTVDRAIQRLGVNLLVVEPLGKSISLMRQMSRTFRNAGAPRLPRGIETEVTP